MAPIGKHSRDDHPLTAGLTDRAKVYVELYPAPLRKSRYLKPRWLARDGQWAVRSEGCLHYLAAHSGVDPYRLWTAAEYKAHDALAEQVSA